MTKFLQKERSQLHKDVRPAYEDDTHTFSYAGTISSKPKRKRRKRRVKEPLTEELLEELLTASDPVAFADAHHLTKRTVPEYLQQLLDEKGLTRAAVIRKAGINETFGYQIFIGTRNCSREKILQLAFAMELSLKETDRLLRAAERSELYCKNRRDAIIIFCLEHNYSLQKTDEELYRFGEKTIC